MSFVDFTLNTKKKKDPLYLQWIARQTSIFAVDGYEGYSYAIHFEKGYDVVNFNKHFSFAKLNPRTKATMINTKRFLSPKVITELLAELKINVTKVNYHSKYGQLMTVWSGGN